MDAQLSISHYRILFSLKDDNEINYYIEQISSRNLSKRQLQEAIKNKEYERLPENTKQKLIKNKNELEVVDMIKESIIIRNKNELEVVDMIKESIIIRNKNNYENISEKILQKIILEDIPSLVKKNNKFVIEYCSDERIESREYEILNKM